MKSVGYSPQTFTPDSDRIESLPMTNAHLEDGDVDVLSHFVLERAHDGILLRAHRNTFL